MPVAADSTLWTADTICVTADGRIICIDADVAEAAAALDTFDAAVIADTTVDNVDAVIVFATAVAEAADALDQLDAIAVPAGIILADVAESAAALDALDADVVSVEVPIAAAGGWAQPRRLRPVYGIGYGILPQLVGEAHGVVVAVVGAGVVVLPDVAAELAASVGVAGHSEAKLFFGCAAASGACGTRGSGLGMIVKFSGSATGRHDDDEAAVIAILLAA